MINCGNSKVRMKNLELVCGAHPTDEILRCAQNDNKINS